MSQQYGELSAPDTLSIERMLPGPIERVWRYVTEPELRKSWLAAGPMELRPGGQVRMEFDNSTLSTEEDEPPPQQYADNGGKHVMQGIVTACEPPHLLSYTWPMGEGEPSEVCIRLTAQGDQVLLQLTHSRLTRSGQILAVSGGWHLHLDVLLARLREETPPLFWATFKKLEAEYSRRLNLV